MSDNSFSTNYDLYKVFYYVAEYKSLTKAAAQLGVSQPAISQSMKQLESDLGLKLTARTGHGIKLTPEGELIYPYIKKGCDAFSQVDTILKDYVPEDISSADNKPKVKKSSAVKEPIVDAPDRKPSVETPKVPVRDVFVTGTQYMHFAGQKLPYRLLEHLPIVLPVGENSVRSNLDVFLKTIGVKIYPIKEYNDFSDMLQGIIHNEGIGCIPYPVVEAALKSGSIYLLEFETDIPVRNE